MRYRSLPLLLASVGFAALLSGCVIAPIGPRPYAVYPGGVYAEPAPAPVVVAPSIGFFGYYGHRGYRNWR